MGLLNGLKDIGLGIGQVVIGIGKAAFAFLKFMLFSAVCVIVGVYSAVVAVFDFAKRAYRKLKKERPNVTPVQTGGATKAVIQKVLRDVKTEVSTNTLRLSDLEKEEVLNDVNEIEKKINNGEANGMQWIEGKNEQGTDEIFDAELIKYNQLDEDAQRRDKSETAFIQKFS